MVIDRCRSLRCACAVAGFFLAIIAAAVAHAAPRNTSHPIDPVAHGRKTKAASHAASDRVREDRDTNLTADPNVRLAQLEQELALIREQLGQGSAVQQASYDAPYGGCDVGYGCGAGCECGCCDGGPCTCGDCGCCGTCRPGTYQGCGGWFVGYAFVFAKPYYKESFEAMHSDLATSQLNLIPFDFDFDLTPRVWLGYVDSCGRGMQVQYWQYDHDAAPLTEVADATNVYGAQTVTVVFPAAISTVNPGDVLSVTSGLKMETIDLEGVQQYCLGTSHFMVSGGLRAVFLDQRSFASVSTESVTTQTLSSFRTFDGVGPTVGVVGTVPSGVPSLNVYGEFRGALLYGEKSLGRTVTPAQPLPGTTTPSYSSALLDNADDVFGGGGIELGLQWKQPSRTGDWFCQAGYSGQLWTDGGAPTLTFLGFEGFSVAIGLTQ